ncbi:hypothetical protein Hypma_004600 [Hypsizygus marmoreus]|uniref:F-box domain-containing protein n=1 Tax=Hypsizygus marmoreus TaxID=39966 RepID=A0A369JXQ7_HYPMA|nr:hypothetical protein Hypma_004600 [Hypsizygus marmoreus]
MPGLHRHTKATPDRSHGRVANRKPPPTPVHRRNATITKLTKESLHQIFVLCKRSAAPSERSAPLSLTWVSKSWRSLARSIPQLWTSLELRKSGGGSLPRQVAHWTNLAGDLPMSLAYNFPNNFPHEFWKHPTLSSTIVPFATRVRHLALAVEPK